MVFPSLSGHYYVTCDGKLVYIFSHNCESVCTSHLLYASHHYDTRKALERGKQTLVTSLLADSETTVRLRLNGAACVAYLT